MVCNDIFLGIGNPILYMMTLLIKIPGLNCSLYYTFEYLRCQLIPAEKENDNTPTAQKENKNLK